MPFIAVVLVAIGIAVSLWRRLVQGGKGDFAPPNLRWLMLPILGLGLQFIALRWTNGWERFVPFTLSQMLLLIFFVANWKHRPLRLLATGVLLNLIAIVSNSGYMPITPQAMIAIHPDHEASQWIAGFTHTGSKDMVLPTAQSTFWFLGDVFVLRRPFPLPTAFSLGDVAIVIGFGWTVYRFSEPRGVQDEPNRSGSSRVCRRRRRTISRAARARSTARR
ncbi:MAG: DUF5317 domain-containing protein [Chloroflexi bacterium]|nr:DUF5317 domain-containing protein [Chloroflexota bacterium]